MIRRRATRRDGVATMRYFPSGVPEWQAAAKRTHAAWRAYLR
jgi:hypothetical protein